MSDKDDELRALRAKIDKADGDILAALEERYGLTDRVTASKMQGAAGGATAAGGAIFRPGREADLLRRVMGEAKNLDPVLLESIWRQIIAFSLARQQERMTIYYSGEDVAAVARFRFGVAAEYIMGGDAVAVIEAVATGKAHIGMLPHWDSDGGWLGALAGAGGRAYIAALTPFAEMPGLVKTVLLAPRLPDQSADDTTLMIAGGDGAFGVKTKSGYHPDAPGLIGIIQNPPAVSRG